METLVQTKDQVMISNILFASMRYINKREIAFDLSKSARFSVNSLSTIAMAAGGIIVNCWYITQIHEIQRLRLNIFLYCVVP